MNGCTYINKKTGEPIAWCANYNSGIMHKFINEGIDVIITEEEFYKHEKRQIKWLEEEGII